MRDVDAPAVSALTDQSEVFELVRFSHIFSSAVREMLELRLLQEVAPEPLTVSQFHLLKLIALNGTHQVGEVADFLGVTPPAATKNIDKLERLGLVTRRQSTGDRRATLLSSSRRGRELVEQFDTARYERLRRVVERFSAEELKQLTQLLERFSLALIQCGESADGLCFRCSAYFDENCPIANLHRDCPYQKLRQDRTVTAEAAAD